MKIPSNWLLKFLCIAFAAAPLTLIAEDQLTVYELLAPESHQFAITYDVSTAVAGARFYFNPIRRGSRASSESVIDRASGAALKWEIVEGKQAKASGDLPERTPDDSLFLKVHLPAPVAKGAEARIRIIKTYEDPASYFVKGPEIVFERGLTIRRNVVVLPAGYELVGVSVPGIVSIQPDGRLRVSFLNDRDDQLLVRVTGKP